MADLKVCKACSKEKTVEDFGTYTSRGKIYKRSECKKCRNIKTREQRDDRTRWLEKNQYLKKVKEDKKGTSDYYRDWHLRKNYGITLKEFDTISSLQNNKCTICGNHNTLHKNLVVDHNHNTGEIRGLLCSPCNSALGHAKDSIKNLEKMIEYLKERGTYGH